MVTDRSKSDFHRTYNIYDISRYFNRRDNDSALENYAVFYEINDSVKNSGAPIRVLGLTIGLCLEGEGEVGIGDRRFKFSKNSLMLLNPNQYVHSITSKEPLRMLGIGVSLEIIESIMLKISGVLPVIIHNPIESVSQLAEDKSLLIQEYMYSIGRRLAAPKTPFKRIKIASLLQALLCEIIEIHDVSNDGMERARSRKEEILSNFILEVLKNFRKERSVSFYADRLCITPKHLSTVSKDITSRTASELIDHYVIMEAKILLAETSLTIQEISNKLNFANQSFFGKYFKHLTGYSPSQFRKMASI